MTIEYSSDIELVPTHLGLEFFEEILENGIRQPGGKIEKVKIEMGSSTGENYCSQIFRVKIQYKLKDNSIKCFSAIVKSIPKSKATEFLQDLQVFLKEKIFYYNVLPLMELFLEDDQQLGARLYHTLRQPVNTLVFEDLSCKGYAMASRESGLDEAHCRLVMKKLGQFHGISMKLAKKIPEIKECFNSGMLAEEGLKRDNGMLMKYFGGNAQELVKLTSTWPGYEEITKKINKYRSNLRENLCRSQLPLAGELQVLNHGDLWVNNILFKYNNADDKQSVHDAVFVDFQLSIWGSPGLDINYFFNTSLQLRILQAKREILIRVYHESLQKTLKELNYTNIPTLADIMDEVQSRELYGFFANYGIFPTISMDKQQSKDNSLDNFFDDEFAQNKVRQMFASKRLEETLKYTLKRFNKLGIWDD